MALPWSDFVQAHLPAMLAMNTVITICVIHWGAVQKSQREKGQIEAKQKISRLVNLIHDLSEFPYNDDRSFERQVPVHVRAAVAKNGKIPRDNRALVTRLNGMDVNFGARFEEIERDLKELGLM